MNVRQSLLIHSRSAFLSMIMMICGNSCHRTIKVPPKSTYKIIETRNESSINDMALAQQMIEKRSSLGTLHSLLIIRGIERFFWSSGLLPTIDSVVCRPTSFRFHSFIRIHHITIKTREPKRCGWFLEFSFMDLAKYRHQVLLQRHGRGRVVFVLAL